MDDTQLILRALSQVPDLVEAARTYKEVNDKAINTISTAVKQQPKAIIPDSEMEKLKNNISQTRWCGIVYAMMWAIYLMHWVQTSIREL